ncbi:MAG: hypothetical protein ABSF85_19480 [Terriglobales bacterium]|jgi:hypothetical protein
MQPHFAPIIALGVMLASAVTVVFIAREMVRKLKQDRIVRDSLAKLKVEQERARLQRIKDYSGLFADREAHERALKTLFASFCPKGYFKDHEHNHEHDTQAAA